MSPPHGDPGLATALYVARRGTGLTLRQLGQDAGGIDYVALKRLEQRLSRDANLRQLANRLLDQKN